MIVDNLMKSIERGKQGLNVGLSTGLPAFDTLTFGVQRKWFTVVSGDSGSGKSSLTLYSYIYQPFKQHLQNSNIDLHFLIFSFEMSAEVLLAKLLSLHLYEEYDKVLSYGQILSLTDTLSEGDYALIQLSKPWLEQFEALCTIIDKPVTAKGLYAVCKEWSRNFGTYKEVETDAGYTREEYIPNNPEQYLIVTVDHIKLLSLGQGHTAKQEIDEACDYLISFRNKCGFTVTVVQQFNRNFKSNERRSGDTYLPGLEDLSDSSGPAQSAETVITIYFPFREKKVKCEGYDIRQMKDRARLLIVAKNRFGMSDKMVMTSFFGENNLWKELPAPDKISDYEQYIKL